MSHEPNGRYGPLSKGTSDELLQLGFVPGWPIVMFSSDDFGVCSIAKAICPDRPDDLSNRRAFTVSHVQEDQMGCVTWEFTFIPELMQVVWDDHLVVPTLEDLQGSTPGQDEVPEPQRYVRGRLAHSQTRSTAHRPTNQIHLMVSSGYDSVLDSTFQIVPHLLDRDADEGLFYLPDEASPLEPVPTPNH